LHVDTIRVLDVQTGKVAPYRTRNDGDLALPSFRQGLREASFIEGVNVIIEQRWGENENDRLPVMAAELVQRRVAVIVAAPGPTLLRPQRQRPEPSRLCSGAPPIQSGLALFQALADREATSLASLHSPAI
jgi:hypothetical protein